MMRVCPGEDGIGTVIMTNATGFDVARRLDELDGFETTEPSRAWVDLGSIEQERSQGARSLPPRGGANERRWCLAANDRRRLLDQLVVFECGDHEEGEVDCGG
jgi:hypothetical protein